MENNKTYAIVPISELNNIDYNEVDQTSSDTVRKNLADTEFVVKWTGSTPASIVSIDPSPVEYTHAGILVEMSKNTWTNPDLEV